MFRVKSIRRNTARVSTASSTEATMSMQNVRQLGQRLIARLPNDINGDTQQTVNCSPDSRKQPPALDLAQVKAPKVAPRDELEKCRSRLALSRDTPENFIPFKPPRIIPAEELRRCQGRLQLSPGAEDASE